MMENKKCDFFISEQEAIDIAENMFLLGNCTEGGILLEKLEEVFLDRLHGVMDGKFTKYLSTYGINKISPLERVGYRDNCKCEKNGWNWDGINGFYTIEQLNQHEFFLYECSLFVNCYVVYMYKVQNEVEFEKMLEKVNKKYFEDICGEIFTDVTMDMCEEEMDDDYMRLLVYGAWYIDSKLSAYEMEKNRLETFSALYDVVDGASSYVTAEDYFDSFFDKLNKNFSDWNKECMRLLMPYMLDSMVGMKETMQTSPSLYFYSSRGMKEFQEIKGFYKEHPYVKYLEALSKFLEDPVGLESTDRDDLMLVDECVEVVCNGTVSTLGTYTSEEYIRIYYYFDYEDEDCGYPIVFSSLFYVAREVFDVLLFVMKEELKLS